MRLQLLIVICLGAGIGMALPRGEPPPSSAARPELAPAEPSYAATRATVAAAPRAAPSWGGETHIKRSADGHFFTTATVNGQPVQFLVDTGATTVALTQDDARRIGLPFDPSSFQVIGTGASGPVRGAEVMINSVSVDGKEVRPVRGAIIEGLETSLLGQTYLSRIGTISIAGDEMVLR